jgi:hypothetical protein
LGQFIFLTKSPFKASSVESAHFPSDIILPFLKFRNNPDDIIKR